MPITRYDIVTAEDSESLTAAVADGGYVPVGPVVASDGYALQAVGVGTVETGTATDYEVVQASSIPELIIQVNTKIVGGFQPVGGVTQWHHAFIQAVGNVEGGGGGGSAAWADITGKPATFTPTIGTTATTAKAGNYAPAWGDVTGKPTTFPPAIGTTATTAKAGDYQPTWAQVSGKPTTFAPVPATATVVGGLKTATAPTIVITDPVDDENVQAAFDSLIAALKLSGVLT